MESSVPYTHEQMFVRSLFCADEGMSSVLYSHAPIFVRHAYYADSGISDKVLVVGHSPGFPAAAIPFGVPSVFLDDVFLDAVFRDEAIKDSVTRRKERKMDFEALGLLKQREPHRRAEIPRYCEKAPKIVSKARPRLIQQPR